MSDIVKGKDRVQGMLGSAERWALVSPKAVVSGSSAQAENVLTDAIHDIACLWDFAYDAASEITRLRQELAEARAKAIEEAAKLADAQNVHVSSSEAFFDNGWESCARHLAAAIRSLAEKEPT